MKITLAAARQRAISAVLCAASLLAACGGGGEPIQRFVARRLIVLGDETSVLNSDGSKYSVNALAADNVTLNCNANPLWVQILASYYGLTFLGCPSGSAPVTVLMLAKVGATVSDIPAQIDAVGGFVEKDLVTLLAGTNDILAQYALIKSGAQNEGGCTSPPKPECSGAAAVLQAAGTALGSQVTQIANSGGRVLISTLPDVGLTPFAISEEAATPGRAAMLSRLSKVFNAYLRNGFIDDGRRIGLLLTDELFANVVKSPAGAGLVDVKHAWCDPAFPPPACTTNTPVPPPSAAASAPASTYLWAGDLLFGSSGHSLLGNQAVSRANSNPF